MGQPPRSDANPIEPAAAAYVVPTPTPFDLLDAQPRTLKERSQGGQVAVDPHAAVGGLVEAFDEVLDLGVDLLIPHSLGRLVHVHHHGPLEVGDGAGYCV